MERQPTIERVRNVPVGRTGRGCAEMGTESGATVPLSDLMPLLHQLVGSNSSTALQMQREAACGALQQLTGLGSWASGAIGATPRMEMISTSSVGVPDVAPPQPGTGWSPLYQRRASPEAMERRGRHNPRPRVELVEGRRGPYRPRNSNHHFSRRDDRSARRAAVWRERRRPDRVRLAETVLVRTTDDTPGGSGTMPPSILRLVPRAAVEAGHLRQRLTLAPRVTSAEVDAGGVEAPDVGTIAIPVLGSLQPIPEEEQIPSAGEHGRSASDGMDAPTVDVPGEGVASGVEARPDMDHPSNEADFEE